VTAHTDSPARGPIDVLAQPVRLSRSPSTVTRPPPLRGQHNDEVLAEFGLTEAEIAALRGAAVI